MPRIRNRDGVVAHVDDDTATRLKQSGWAPVDKPAPAPDRPKKTTPRRRRTRTDDTA